MDQPPAQPVPPEPAPTGGGPGPPGFAALLAGLAVDDDVRRRLDLLLVAHTLTAVTRVNRLLDDSRGETSAEHSWHLAMTALVLAPRYAPDVDLERVLTMVALHDLVEVEVGDVPIYDQRARAEVVDRERMAARRLFARLPSDEGDRLLALWREGEEARTDDARFAKALDRLQPLLLHWGGRARVWLDRGVRVEFERRLVATIAAHWPPLRPVAAALVEDAQARGMFPDEPPGALPDEPPEAEEGGVGGGSTLVR